MTETAPPADYSDLSALFVNCTLRPSPSPSHTDRLLDVSRGIMTRAGVSIDSLRLVDHDVAPGVQPDMTDADEVDRPLERDDWPRLWKRVRAADILVVGTPIWLGERSSVCSRLVERLYAQSAITDDDGQYAFYGKVGGCLVTGNEDGVKHVGMGLLYALQHVGYTIPPQADAGWLGEIGPGPSYGDPGDDGPVGFDNDFTQRNTTFMTWNLLHLARMLKDAGGIPAYGNQPGRWKQGERFGYRDPEPL